VAPQLIEAYVSSGKLRIVWHDFAWIGQESRLAAQAARCAGGQNRFWAYHDHLFQNQRGENAGQFSPSNLKSYALMLGLDPTTFATCLDAGADLPAIREDLATARAQGITATPSFLLNGQRLVGALNPGAFAQAIEAELQRVGH
jgi:protein-disulfide isomerase